ncbi:renalase [Massilia sp. MP_M2]|uniref:NAD(P)/FAD-dependent oxidoreductase n=1 Tax=Massilia sp. MP_M2 TaxID=3071713 RepID=UPI00319DDB03
MKGARMRVAVVGAGIAGAACARALADAGHAVQVFDKSRGVGGRMSTRRVTSVAGADAVLGLDHGTPGFAAVGADFLGFVEEGQRAGLLARWTPRLAPHSAALQGGAMWVATPDMPALCRALLMDLPLHTLCTVDGVRRSGAMWSIESAGVTVADGFDAVALAIPPQQAAVLLGVHRPDWAVRAQAVPMLPVWVLMGITDAPASGGDWHLAQPASGPLALVLRNDAKPARAALAAQAQWVVHATPDWTGAHLDTPPDQVQALLQAALADCVGGALAWRFAAVHRWLYATLAAVSGDEQTDGAHACAGAWWDVGTGLGVCGDALAGGGVEGAWRSGRALAALVTAGANGDRA